ncbi:hypothetical protein CEXT_480051 [Caerostris extrusa]|uniref:Uncharacterized protein n=1 Tax=Caerostris extrusa TaxID=172846 RepID=A0AAV4S425_CAEEX|nr:hypothetical protein CEXT_480051 [Caerostris extrusa]
MMMGFRFRFGFSSYIAGCSYYQQEDNLHGDGHLREKLNHFRKVSSKWFKMACPNGGSESCSYFLHE